MIDTRLHPELSHPAIVEFPLRGEWMAIQSPAARIPSHGTDVLGQRYAFDFMQLDRRGGGRYHPAGALRTLLLGVPTNECYGWGQPVHAPFEGDVVATWDGVPERSRVHPLREILAATRTALTFRPTPDAVARLMGNAVILRSGDVHAAFAHLVPGSVTVEPGQPVDTGTVIGRVGHSGNSTAPHLHFQLMDGPDALSARGLPCAFRALEIQATDGRWHRAEGHIPGPTERIRLPVAG